MKKIIRIVTIMSISAALLSSMGMAQIPKNQLNVLEFQPRAATAFFIDNDSNDSNCSNSRVGFNEYLSDTGHYNNDARRQITKGNQYKTYYRWSLKKAYQFTGGVYAQLNVWLNNKYFLDPAAEYSINSGDSYSFYTLGTIDQKYAKAGWNATPRVYLPKYSSDPYTYSYMAELTPSGRNISGYTGADAIQMIYTK